MTPSLNALLTVVSFLLFGLGLACLLTRRAAIRQVVGLKLMLQGVSLALVHAGYLQGDLFGAQAMVISALIVEAVVISVALALVVNIYRHYPSGEIDDLSRLRG